MDKAKLINKTYLDKNTNCLIWTGCRDKDGYGRLKVKGKNQKAHRVSFSLHHNMEIPNLLVLHTCDTPSCINPDHLFLGTHADNTKDMLSKGRKNILQKAKLSEDDKTNIQNTPKYHGVGSYLARVYGVSENTISKIRRTGNY